MKQIKGEPWPPGETLAGHRDGIQMGDHGRIIQGVWGLPFFIIISYNIFIYAAPFKTKFTKCLDGKKQEQDAQKDNRKSVRPNINKTRLKKN